MLFIFLKFKQFIPLLDKIASIKMMLGSTTNNKKSHGKAMALAVIYALHLLFFQALLAAPGNNEVGNFKPLFTNSQKSPVTPHKTKHPAATYYSMLIKQGNGFAHPQNESPGAFVHTIKISALQIIDTQRYIHLPFISFHPGDIFFQLYRLARVFLI
jgi:hypothetical protein